jgi:predicted nucleotidyltransferase component of viral defense system
MAQAFPLDYREIRRIAITAIFSDDFLFERVVLKGGNALSLALGLGNRTSLDLDF